MADIYTAGGRESKRAAASDKAGDVPHQRGSWRKREEGAPPLVYAKNRASRLNGEVSYTYAEILSSQRSGSDTILSGKKFMVRPKGGGHRPMAPLNTPLQMKFCSFIIFVSNCDRVVFLALKSKR